MHSRKAFFYTLLLAASVACPSVQALETAFGSNDRASNAALVRHLAAQRASQIADVAALQARVDAIIRCSGKGKFHTTSNPVADTDGCSDIQPVITN